MIQSVYRVATSLVLLLAAAPATVRASGGSAHSWGEDTYGQLGDGGGPTTFSPVAVTGLGSGVTHVASGSYHGLAVVNGAAYDWGDNGNGEIGNGTTTEADTPVAVPGLGSGVTAVAGGASDSFAIKSGTLYAWGNNSNGQLGDGDQVQTTSPVAVSGLGSGVTAVAAGLLDSAAIKGGALFAWGYNTDGQVGNGTASNTNVLTPVAVSGMGSGVTAVAIGNGDALAIKGGALYAWGSDQDSQLGDGSSYPEDTPQATSLTSGVTAIAAGAFFNLAVQNGHVYSWGYDGYGTLGNGSYNDTGVPTEIDPTDLSNIVAVAAGERSGYALSIDGSLWDWGDNTYGELGLSTSTSFYLNPQHLLPPTGYIFTGLDADPGGLQVFAILSPIPEPSTWAMLLLGATALIFCPRRTHSG